MALQTGANGSLPGVPFTAPPAAPPFQLPRATGRRTSMGAFAPWAQAGGMTSPMMALPTTSEPGHRPHFQSGAPSFVAAPEPHPMTSGQVRIGGTESGSSWDTLIAAVLNHGPVVNPSRGGEEVANGNRLSPVREFPVSPSLFSPGGGGIQSPSGLKPEVLKMLLSKPHNPFQNRPVIQNQERIHTSVSRVAAAGVNSPVERGNPLSSPQVPASRSGSNPSLPIKKRVQSNGSGTATSASQGAPRELLASEGINSPCLPETKPFRGGDSASTNPSQGLLKSVSDTSSQSVSPQRRLRNGLAVTPNQRQGVALERNLGPKQQFEDRKRPDETDVLKMMLSAREKELEAVRRERDAVQLMACATKSLLERKDEVIEALKERVAALEVQVRSHVCGHEVGHVAGPTESEEIALAALTGLQGEEKARVASFRKPRTPSVTVTGGRMQRIRSFSSPLGRTDSKSNLWHKESAQGRFDEGSKADGRTPRGANGRGSGSTERPFEDSKGQSDVLEALMALQGGRQEASDFAGGSESSGEARLLRQPEEILSGEEFGLGSGVRMSEPAAEAPSKKRKLGTGRELSSGEEEPGEVVASPVLLRLPGKKRHRVSTSNREYVEGAELSQDMSWKLCPKGSGRPQEDVRRLYRIRSVEWLTESRFRHDQHCE